VSWTEGWSALGWQCVVGAALTMFVARAASDLLWWLVPLLGGLTLAVPLTVLTTRQRLAAVFVRLGLLLTPEDTAPPPLLVRADRLDATWRAVLGPRTDALRRRPGERSHLRL